MKKAADDDMRFTDVAQKTTSNRREIFERPSKHERSKDRKQKPDKKSKEVLVKLSTDFLGNGKTNSKSKSKSSTAADTTRDQKTEVTESTEGGT